MERVDVPELLDEHAGSKKEIAATLRDLRRINRFFGGTSTIIALLLKIASRRQKRELSVLDVAAGNGDILSQSAVRLAKDGVSLRAVLLDRERVHFSPQTKLPRIAADALSLPFADSSFDVVTCSLFLHHLAPRQIQQFARESMRVCRAALVINDLIRCRRHLLLVYAGMPTFSRLTRHDSVASVRRAYTPAEAASILHDSGAPISNIDITRHFLFRMGIVAWKSNRTTT